MGYWLLGFLLTHLPMRSQSEGLVANQDKYMHCLLYAGLALLLATWLGACRKTRSTIVLTFLICSLYGVLDEGLQALIPTRDASLGDWIADVVGTSAGCLGYGVLAGIWQAKCSPDE
ncbi:MAG: VanZ family protein [Planctomycetota bacterium]|nr:VanZ family protein [Planctomycetota bacterium]